MSRVYVASAFANKPAVRELQRALVDAGHSITHDWTVEDASHLPEGTPEWFDYLFCCGDKDLLGIESADAVVVLAHPEMRDTRFEMGYALGAGVPVYVLDYSRAVSVFYGHCELVDSVDALITALDSGGADA